MSKDLTKILSESAGLSESTQEQITEAWNAKLAEAREELSDELRSEYAQKFKHDKAVFAESVDSFITDKLSAELNEFAEDKKQLVAERVAYKAKVSEHSQVLNQFITRQVTKEVKELHSDKAKMKENFKKLENFLLKQLSEEIREFRDDKKDLVAQKVKMVAEGKKHLHNTKQQFVKRATKVIEANINTILQKEISQFKSDIKESRENDFGRRIFEAFAGEYLTSYLNEGTEVSKLRNVLAQKDSEISAITESAKQKQIIAEGLQSKLNVAKDRLSRERKLAVLLSPLGKEKKAVMKDLLESTQTSNLEAAYNKYLPAVLNESKPAPQRKRTQTNRKLTESAKLSTKTGDKAKSALHEGADSQLNNELAEIRALAGLK